MTLVDNPVSTFTTQELERLGIYKAAIAAGFYTDWDGTAEWTDTRALAWLRSSSGSDDGFPFTPEERQRLEGARAAVAAGYYNEASTSGGQAGRQQTETPEGPAR